MYGVGYLHSYCLGIMFGSIFGLVYALIATPFYQSTTTMYPALESESSGGILGSSIKGLAESYGLMGLGSAPTYNIPDIVLSRRIKRYFTKKIVKRLKNNFSST